jgi:hypothetical protein
MSSMGSIESGWTSSRYRQRYGRGGRLHLDRGLTSDELEAFDGVRKQAISKRQVLQERWRFDPREVGDEKPVSLNEFSVEYNSFLKLAYLQSNVFSRQTSSSSASSTSYANRRHPSCFRQPDQSSSRARTTQ